MPIELNFSQFKVGVMLKDLNLENDLRARLQSKGFQTALYNQNNAEANVLVLDVGTLSEPLSDFVEKALSVNAEMKFVMICSPDFAETLLEYREYNTYELILNTEALLLEKLLWSVENACSELYFFYQNVEMAKQLKHTKQEFENAMKVVDQVKVSATIAAPEEAAVPSQSDQRDIKHLLLIRELRKIEDFNESVNYYLTQAPHKKRIYFSLNAQENTFQCTYAVGFPLNKVRDLRYASNDSELRNLIGLKFSILPEGFEKFLLQLFDSPHFAIFPVSFYGEVVGVFVFLNSEGAEEKENEMYYHDLIWPVVSLQLEALWSRIRINDMEVRDRGTIFYNAKYYQAKLKEEFQRADRMKHSLSLVRFRFDQFDEVKAQLPTRELQEKLNTISEVVATTGRTHDVACRLDENDFALILPHCSRKFAAVRAERLRKSLETHPQLKDQFKISISFGVSEFPSLCSRVDDLEQSAVKALTYIMSKGGNKVCISRAPQDYTPPFEIQVET